MQSKSHKIIAGSKDDYASFRLYTDEEFISLVQQAREFTTFFLFTTDRLPIYIVGNKQLPQTWVFFDDEKEALERRNALVRFNGMSATFVYKIEERENETTNSATTDSSDHSTQETEGQPGADEDNAGDK